MEGNTTQKNRYPKPLLTLVASRSPITHSWAHRTLQDMIKTCAKDKSVGLDQVGIDILSTCPKATATLLHNMFPVLFRHAVTPTWWRRPQVSLLYKKNDPKDPANYRPVALPSHIRKFYERIYRRYLMNLPNLKTHHSQCGFLHHSGAIDCAYIIAESCNRMNLQYATKPLLVLLDIIKAYDSVWRPFLWELLAKRGLHRHLIAVLMSLFEDVTVMLSLNGKQLGRAPCITGLMQGAVLSPFLFNLFLDPLLEQLNKEQLGAPKVAGTNIPSIGFADDLTLISDASSKPALARTQRQLNLCTAYAVQHGFRFSPQKSHFTAPATFANKIKLTLQGQELGYKDEVECLGISFVEASISTPAHLAKNIAATEAAALAVASLGVFFSNINLKRKANVFKAFIRSHLEYGIQILPLTRQNIEALNSTMLDALSHVFCTKKGSWAQARIAGCDTYTSRAALLRADHEKKMDRLHKYLFSARIYHTMAKKPTSLIHKYRQALTKTYLEKYRKLWKLYTQTSCRHKAKEIKLQITQARSEVVRQAWIPISKRSKNVAALTNDPRCAHPLTRIQDPGLTFMLPRLVAGIWPPARLQCHTCQPPRPIGREHLRICTDAESIIMPRLHALTQQSQSLKTSPYERCTESFNPVPADAEHFSIYLALALLPAQMEWGATRQYRAHTPSLNLLSALRRWCIRARACIRAAAPYHPPPSSPTPPNSHALPPIPASPPARQLWQHHPHSSQQNPRIPLNIPLRHHPP